MFTFFTGSVPNRLRHMLADSVLQKLRRSTHVPTITVAHVFIGRLIKKIEKKATMFIIAQTSLKKVQFIITSCQSRCKHIKKFRCIKQLHVTRFAISTLLFFSITVATIFKSFLRLSQSLSPFLCLCTVCILCHEVQPKYIRIPSQQVMLADKLSKIK